MRDRQGTDERHTETDRESDEEGGNRKDAHKNVREGEDEGQAGDR